MKRKILLVLFIAIMGIINVNAQSRGPTPGEFYITFPWYYNENTDLEHAMLAYTDNHGRNFQALYTSVENSGEMQVGTVYADAAPNVLYNRPGNLYRSFDNGQTWEFVEAQTGEYPPGYATGNINNEIFKQSQGVIYKSEENGNNWVQMSTDIPGRMEVGNQLGELYAYSSRRKYDDGWYYETTIRHSLNDGADFVIDTIDIAFTGNYASNSPRIIRGAQEGEFYLVSWWPGPKFKVFHSYDYWHNFEFKYKQPENAIFWDEMFAFTAGRGECEFYAFKLKTWVEGYYFRLHVYHSADCAQTFTEYVHELTPDYDGNPAQIIYTIAASTNPDEGGEVTGAGYYNEGDEVNLSATPYEGYTFQNWTENGISISEEPELNFTADSTRTLKANFQLINSIANPEFASISIYPNPTKGIVTLSFPQVHKYNDVLFEVLSIDGRKLISKPIYSELSTHDISSLPAGMYLYRFAAGGLLLKTGKFIIR
jgi:hypothetical protein